VTISRSIRNGTQPDPTMETATICRRIRQHSPNSATVAENGDCHDTRSRNWRHKSTLFSGAGFRRQFFVPYHTRLEWIFLAPKTNLAEIDVDDEFAGADAIVIADIVAKSKLKRNTS